MKHKRIKIAAIIISLFFISSTALAASETLQAHLFKGKLVFNNKLLHLKHNLIQINGNVYVPIRALAESLNGYTSYDKSNQTIYVEQPLQHTMKSTVHEKPKMICLHYSFSQVRLSLHTETLLRSGQD